MARTVQDVNKEVDAIDAQIAALRAKKMPLAAERAALIGEEQLRAKLGRFTSEEKRRIVVKPHAASAVGNATK